MSGTKRVLCSIALASTLLAGSAFAGETQDLPLPPGESQNLPQPKSLKAIHGKDRSRDTIVQLNLLELIATLLTNLGMPL